MNQQGDDVMEVDVLYVGVGAATLASAIRLMTLAKKSGKTLNVVMLEKAKAVGAHQLSGAVMDPVSFRDVLEDLGLEDPGLGLSVSDDRMLFLGEKSSFKIPFTPPSLRNHGNQIISLSELVVWLAGKAEGLGVNIFTGFAGADLIRENGRVAGVVTGEKGIDKNGNKKPNYEAGIKIKANVTVLGEGARGSLTKVLTREKNLGEGRNPQTYSTGIKEIWKVKEEKHKPGLVLHTMGFPLNSKTFGGGFIYHAKGGYVYLGLVVGLDYKDPTLDLHGVFSRFKQHPLLTELLEGGEMIRYGAKTIPEGGYYAVPKYWGDGFLIVGDSASFLNSARLKGIHLAMKSGQLAAEAIMEAILNDDFSESSLGIVHRLVEQSFIKKELWRVRNFHQGFRSGLWAGIVQFSFQMLTGGRGLFGRLSSVPDQDEIEKKSAVSRPFADQKITFDDTYTFSKTTDVFKSGTIHGEDQPAHLRVSDPDICRTKCREEYGNPCEHFCPAHVYEFAEEGPGGGHLRINAANCVHCKTCDIKDPYGIITWVPPEGGGGPDYAGM